MSQNQSPQPTQQQPEHHHQHKQEGHHYPFQSFFGPKSCEECQQTPHHEKTNQYCVDDTIKEFSWNKWYCQQRAYWQTFDVHAANEITEWKRDYILSIGDVRVRSVLMAVSASVCYRLMSYKTTSLLAKTRNLGVSFVLMGVTFVPELFNPFIVRQLKQ